MMKKYAMRVAPSTFKIQITSMVDMFVILLVFLLKSYSTSPVNIAPREGMVLPESSALANPVDVAKVIISNDGVYLNDEQVLVLDKGQVPAKELDSRDSRFIKPLYKALVEQAKGAKPETQGQLLLQADRELSYQQIEKILFTSGAAGFSDVKLAVLSKH